MPIVFSNDVALPTSTEPKRSNAGHEWESAKASYKSGLWAIPAALGSETAQENYLANKDRAEEEAARSDSPKSWDEMKFGDNFLPYVRQLAIQSGPYAAEFVVGGMGASTIAKGAAVKAAGRFAADTVAKRTAINISKGVAPELAAKSAIESVGGDIARTAGGVAASYPSSVGDVLGNQYEQAGKFNLPAAAALGVPYAAANAVGIEGALARGLPVTKFGSRTARAAGTGAIVGASEAAGETFQEVMNQAGRKAVDPSATMTSPDAIARYRESAIGGGLLGFIPGAAGGAMSSRQATAGTPPAEDLLTTQNANDPDAGVSVSPVKGNYSQGVVLPSANTPNQHPNIVVPSEEAAPVRAAYNTSNAEQIAAQLKERQDAEAAVTRRGIVSEARRKQAAGELLDSMELEAMRQDREHQQTATTPKGTVLVPDTGPVKRGFQLTPYTIQQLAAENAEPERRPTLELEQQQPEAQQVRAGNNRWVWTKGQLPLDLRGGDTKAAEQPAVSTPEGQTTIPGMLTREQEAVRAGTPVTKSHLLTTLNAATRQLDKKSPVSKDGTARGKWLSTILQSSNPVNTIRATFANGSHPQAELLDTWHQVLTGEPIDEGQLTAPNVTAGQIKGGDRKPTGQQLTTSSPAGNKSTGTTEQLRSNYEAIDAQLNEAIAARDAILKAHDHTRPDASTPEGKQFDKLTNDMHTLARHSNKAYFEWRQELDRVASQPKPVEAKPKVGKHKSSKKLEPLKPSEARTTKVARSKRDAVIKDLQAAFASDQITHDEYSTLVAMREARTKGQIAKDDVNDWTDMVLNREAGSLAWIRAQLARAEQVMQERNARLAKLKKPGVSPKFKLREEAIDRKLKRASQMGDTKGIGRVRHAAVDPDLEGGLDEQFTRFHLTRTTHGETGGSNSQAGGTDFDRDRRHNKLNNAPEAQADEDLAEHVSTPSIDMGRRNFIKSLGAAAALSVSPRIRAESGVLSDRPRDPRLADISKAATTLHEPLKWIEKHAPNQSLKDLAGAVLKVINNTEVPLRVIEAGRVYSETFPGALQTASGVTSVKGNTAKVYIRGEYAGDLITILHEGLHTAAMVKTGASLSRIGAPVQWKQMEGLTSEVRSAAGALGALKFQVNKYLNSLPEKQREEITSDVSISEGISSIDEFFVRSLSDYKFQAFLQSVPYKGADKDSWKIGDSIWDALVDLVRRLLGVNARNNMLEEAMFESNNLLHAMRGQETITTADTGSPIYAERVGAKGIVDSISNTVKSLSVESVPENMRSMMEASAPKWLGAVTLRQIVDIFGTRLKALTQYAGNIHKMDAAVNSVALDADKISRRWGELPIEQSDKVAEVMALATLHSMHPDQALEVQKWLKHDDHGIQQQYNSLKEKWAALSPEAKAVYTEAKKMLATHWDKVRELMKAEIAKNLTNEADREAALKAVDVNIGRTQGPYFPLQRFGKHILTYIKGDDKASYGVEFFESAAERDRTAKEYAADGYTVKRKTASEFTASESGVPAAFKKGVDEMLGTIEDAGLRSDLQDSMNQLYLRSLPEVSGAKRFLHRRGVKGWSTDMRRAFASSMFHGAFYRAKLQFAPELRRDILALREEVRQSPDEAQLGHVANEITRRHDGAMHREDTPLLNVLSNLGYMWYLGFTPSFAVVNMAQNPLIAYPMMASRHGWANAAREMMRAAKEFAGVKWTQVKDEGWNAELDIDTVTKNSEERAALKAWLDGNLIDLTQAHDLGAVSSGSSEKWRTFMRAASYLPHHTEVFNRVVAGLAAFRLARRAGESAEAATKYGEQVIANAHFDYSASNKPYYMTPAFSKVGKLVFMFKQYQQHMLYALARNFYKAVKGDKEAARAMAGLVTLHGLAAGAMGLPFMGAAMGVANLLHAAGGDPDEPWDAETAFRQTMAEAFGVQGGELASKGLGRLTPLEISERVGLGNILWRSTGQYEMSKDSFNQMVGELAGGPVGAMVGSAFDAKHFFETGQTEKGWEQLTPKVLKDLIKSYRFADEGVSSKKGIGQMQPLSAWDVTTQAMGFTPATLAEHYAAQSAVKGAEQGLKDRRDLLITKLTLARLHNDSETVSEVKGQIKHFNQTNPHQAIQGSALIQSYTSALKAQHLANDAGVYVSPKNHGLLEKGAFANVNR